MLAVMMAAPLKNADAPSQYYRCCSRAGVFGAVVSQNALSFVPLWRVARPRSGTVMVEAEWRRRFSRSRLGGDNDDDLCGLPLCMKNTLPPAWHPVAGLE